jgi:hypothetical protein
MSGGRAGPDRPYWYRFRVGREESAVGRTRTLPAPGARVERLRFVRPVASLVLLARRRTTGSNPPPAPGA